MILSIILSQKPVIDGAAGDKALIVLENASLGRAHNFRGGLAGTGRKRQIFDRACVHPWTG
jgi:hypothetical protein